MNGIKKIKIREPNKFLRIVDLKKKFNIFKKIYS